MGYDSSCTLIVDGRADAGTARLEDKELVFRGATRLVLPLATIDRVDAHDGSLTITAAGRQLVLRMGADAAKWARRIANPPSRIDKLGVKPGHRVAILDTDDESLQGEMAERGAVVESDPGAVGLDAIFVGVRTPADLSRLKPLSRRLAPAGALWVIRAKGKGAPIGEAESMAAGRRAGLVDVKVVSFSASHSAEKYVIPVARRAPPVRPAAPRSRTSRSSPSRGRT
jgi:hypothetical protein